MQSKQYTQKPVEDKFQAKDGF